MPIAYSYQRFSSPAQAAGDSIRRQTESRDRWLADHPAVTLDTTLKMSDLGRSAYKRKDWATYALAQFVKRIEGGSVPAGSYLLVENLDRLSRESAGEATELFLSIVNKGVTIVQLAPVVLEFKKPVDTMSLMFAIVELSRGHSESAMKSERSGAAWMKKQKDAATKLVTKKLPTWIKYENEKLVLDPVKAAVVRRIFQMSIDGMGGATIAKQLNREGVPVLGKRVARGRSVGWGNSVVKQILASPATYGTYVPYRKRAAKGEPVDGYFPAVIDLATFYAARTAVKTRAAVGRGRQGKHVNLFAGLLVDARDGRSMTYRHQKRSPCVIAPTMALSGISTWVSFPSEQFETGVLSCLKEIGAAELMESGQGSEIETLTAQLAEVDGLTKKWEAQMDDVTIVAVVARKLSELATKRAALAAELETAQRNAASPLSAAWGEFRSLADWLKDDNSDETRLKVRAAIRRTIQSVTCTFVAITRHKKLARVEVKFHGANYIRHYMLAHEARKPVIARSFTFPTDPDPLRLVELGEASGLDVYFNPLAAE